MVKTYSSHTLHAEHKSILRQISRVGEGVLLPQLSEQGVQATNVCLIQRIVAFEEQMDASTYSDDPVSQSFPAKRITRVSTSSTTRPRKVIDDRGARTYSERTT